MHVRLGRTVTQIRLTAGPKTRRGRAYGSSPVRVTAVPTAHPRRALWRRIRSLHRKLAAGEVGARTL